MSNPRYQYSNYVARSGGGAEEVDSTREERQRATTNVLPLKQLRGPDPPTSVSTAETVATTSSNTPSTITTILTTPSGQVVDAKTTSVQQSHIVVVPADLESVDERIHQ
jgi:hypothetical protein